MKVYRRCKAKCDVKAGKLADFTTVEVFGKPVNVPNGQVEIQEEHIKGILERRLSKSGHEIIMGGDRPFVKNHITGIMQLPRTAFSFKFATNHLWAKIINFDLIEHIFDMYVNLDDCFKIVVKDRYELDFLISHGIQPSDIQVIGERDCIYQYQKIKLSF